MGSVNSVAEVKHEEDSSTNQRDGDASKTLIEDQSNEEESKTLIEDQRDGGEDSKTLAETQTDKQEKKDSRTLTETQRDGEEEKDSKTLTDILRDGGEESKTLTEDLNKTEEKEEEEDEEECGFCSYIKGGGCKDEFIAFENCADETEKNGQRRDVTKCKEFRVKLKTCMYDNFDYYEPILAGEARMIAKILMGLDREEQDMMLAGDATAITKALSKLQTEELSILPAEAAAIAKAFRELKVEKKEEEVDKSKGNEMEKMKVEAD